MNGIIFRLFAGAVNGTARAAGIDDRSDSFQRGGQKVLLAVLLMFIFFFWGWVAIDYTWYKPKQLEFGNAVPSSRQVAKPDLPHKRPRQ